MTKSPKFAFIKARWHAEIVDQALVGFENRLVELGLDAPVDVFDVPGAFEMPLLAQKLAQTGTYTAIAAAALVVDGGIYRHDFVAQAVVSGLMDVGIRTGVPILSVSLTPHHFQSNLSIRIFSWSISSRRGERPQMPQQRWRGCIRDLQLQGNLSRKQTGSGSAQWRAQFWLSRTLVHEVHADGATVDSHSLLMAKTGLMPSRRQFPTVLEGAASGFTVWLVAERKLLLLISLRGEDNELSTPSVAF